MSLVIMIICKKTLHNKHVSNVIQVLVLSCTRSIWIAATDVNSLVTFVKRQLYCSPAIHIQSLKSLRLCIFTLSYPTIIYSSQMVWFFMNSAAFFENECVLLLWPKPLLQNVYRCHLLWIVSILILTPDDR